MKVLSILTLLFLSFGASAEGLSKIALEKRMQQGISKELKHLKNLDTSKITLNDYLDRMAETCEQQEMALAKEGVEQDKLNRLRQGCYEKIDKMERIGDLQTVVDMQISQLQEMQSSQNYLFHFTRLLLGVSDAFCEDSKCKAETYLFLPVLVVVDIVTLPIALVGSIVTGF